MKERAQKNLELVIAEAAQGKDGLYVPNVYHSSTRDVTRTDYLQTS